MPTFIKTPAQEAKWNKAKEVAHKQYGPKEDDRFWSIVNSIYHRMAKAFSPPLSSIHSRTSKPQSETSTYLSLEKELKNKAKADPAGSTSNLQAATIKVSPETIKAATKVKKATVEEINEKNTGIKGKVNKKQAIREHLERNPQDKAFYSQFPSDHGVRDRIMMDKVHQEGSLFNRAIDTTSPRWDDPAAQMPRSPNNEKLGVYMAAEMNRIQSWIAWLVANGMSNEDASAMAWRFATVPSFINPGYLSTQYLLEDFTRRAKTIPFLHKSFLPLIIEEAEIRKSFDSNKKRVIERLKHHHPNTADKIADSIGCRSKIKKALFQKSIRGNIEEKEGIDPKTWDGQVGYSPKKKKFFGYSHRAYYGFGIGSEVKQGSVLVGTGYKVGYKAKTLADAKKMAQDFAEEVS